MTRRGIPGLGATADEVLRWAAGLAVLAPSKHNAQPWWFEVRDGVVEVHADGARAMPVSDPDGRELVVGCGAALFTLRLALRCAGYDPVTVEFPEGGAFSVVARVAPGRRTASPRSEEDLALLAAVTRRHTDRGPLDASDVPADVPFELQRAAEREGATLHLLSSPGARHALAGLVAKADRAQAADPAFAAELRLWLREPTPTSGIPLEARGPGAAAAYRRAFVQRDFDVTGTAPDEEDGVDDPLVGVLWTGGDRPADWLRAGQALQAVLLRATVEGVRASFLNQPIEIPPLRAVLREELALPGYPQVVLRLGHGRGGVPSPRRPVADVLNYS